MKIQTKKKQEQQARTNFISRLIPNILGCGKSLLIKPVPERILISVIYRGAWKWFEKSSSSKYYG